MNNTMNNTGADRNVLPLVMLMVGRHEPTAEQHALAQEAGYVIQHYGDVDAFDIPESALSAFLAADAVACAHVLIGNTVCAMGVDLAAFNNQNRAPAGQPPQFLATMLVVVSPEGEEVICV